jgi:hypothetical protein
LGKDKMTWRKFKILDGVFGTAIILFVGAILYRWKTQAYFDWGSLIVGLFAIRIYWGIRTPPGEPSRYKKWDDFPFTSTALILLGLSIGFGIIWTFAFADFAEERWRHAGISAAIIILLGALFLFIRSKEPRSSEVPSPKKEPNQSPEPTAASGRSSP